MDHNSYTEIARRTRELREYANSLECQLGYVYIRQYIALRVRKAQLRKRGLRWL